MEGNLYIDVKRGTRRCRKCHIKKTMESHARARAKADYEYKAYYVTVVNLRGQELFGRQVGSLERAEELYGGRAYEVVRSYQRLGLPVELQLWKGPPSRLTTRLRFQRFDGAGDQLIAFRNQGDTG